MTSGLLDRIVPVLAVLLLAAGAAEAQHEHPTGQPEMAADHPGMAMKGRLGPYPMTREASGTSWQPEAAPHEGKHGQWDSWSWMAHGFGTFGYTHQGGERGSRELAGSKMFMFMEQTPLGPGTWGLRQMISLEPLFMNEDGYPLLFQTGETADGKTELIDRQHPHDFFMELSTTYSLPLAEKSSLFAYFGLPGEPALGPPAFMHRFSGMENPEAPLTHHWLDSTHITYGVLTLGAIWDSWKLEASTFRGREPDENRWDIEEPRFDSYSARLSYLLTKEWTFQVSYGILDSPEQLKPNTDTHRPTASVSYHKAWEGCNWQTMLAWGQNRNDPGHTLDGFLLESAVNWQKIHTLFGRVEHVEKDELFPEGEAYQDPYSFMLFARVKL